METWSLHHPQLGLIELQRGYDQEFAAAYPDWPRAGEESRTKDGEWKPITVPALDASIPARIKAMMTNPPVRVQLLVDGQPVRRFASLPNGRLGLAKHMGKKLETPSVVADRSKPHLNVTKSMFGDIHSIDFRQGEQIVEFEAPPGSRGEKYKQAMEDSQFKRVAYPILAGLGKGGWALAVIILGPIVGRIIGAIVDWLIQFVPDLQLPDFPPPPDITLPVPNPPSITLPVPRWPDINFPDLPAPPDWVLFMIEHSKIWVPIVIGIGFGILALKNHKKSEAIKEQWRAQQAGHPVGAVPSTGDESGQSKQSD